MQVRHGVSPSTRTWPKNPPIGELDSCILSQANRVSMSQSSDLSLPVVGISGFVLATASKAILVRQESDDVPKILAKGLIISISHLSSTGYIHSTTNVHDLFGSRVVTAFPLQRPGPAWHFSLL